jgi:Pyruvate/2-oxoacid:ferredoxin oxidoreductase delta subunit
MSRAAQAVAITDGGRQTRAPRFDAVRCKQCGLCAHVCPKRVLDPPVRSTPRLIDLEACSGCRTCEYICPDFAVKMALVPVGDGDPLSPSGGTPTALREAGR